MNAFPVILDFSQALPIVDGELAIGQDGASQSAAPQQTAGAGSVDRRFLTTMPPPVPGGRTEPNGAGRGAQNPAARQLGSSLFYAAQQDPGQYARLLHLQDLTGIPPIVSAGNETEIQQWVDANRIDPHYFTTIAPNIAAWACDPDNAAVAGVDEILRLGRIEQNAVAMGAAPSLNAFLNRYGSAAIPTSADDPQMQAWKGVNSFWGPMGKGLVNPLVAAANQALARQHAGDTAYRATPRPEPTTIAEEAEQANTPRTLQVYTPPPPTIAPLPTPRQEAASIVRYPADAMAAVTYTAGKPDDPALLADIQKQQSADRDAEQNRRDAETATAWDWLTQPINLGHLRENIAANEALINAGPTLADVESEERSIKAPWYHPQWDMARVHELETAVRSFSTNAAKMFLTPFGVAMALAGPVGEGVGEAIPETASVIRLLEGAVAAGFGVKGIYDQAHQGWTKQPGESWADYATRTSGNAAMVLGGVTGGARAASGALDGLGYEQAASEGLSDGAREAMGWSAATEPSVGAPPGTNAFFENLSQAMAEAADSKLRGRSPERFQQALQAIFQGNDSLRIPVDQFNDYFDGKSMDVATVAREIGARNYAEAVATGGSVRVPVENFLSLLDPEHQQGLLSDVVDPASGLTLRQHQGMQRWAAAGGQAQWETKPTQSDPETTPERQTVQGDLGQQDAAIQPDSFSIIDWTGYPPGPRPRGTVRLLPDAEYQVAFRAAKNYTSTTRRADPATHANQHIHHIKPVKFGGSPADPANMINLSPTDHHPFTTWWRSLQRSIE